MTLATEVVEHAQTGLMDSALGLSLLQMSVEEPRPVPVDRKNGSHATNETGAYPAELRSSNLVLIKKRVNK